MAGHGFARTVRHDGTAALDGHRDDVGEQLTGQAVVLRVQAAGRTRVVLHRRRVLRQVRLTGLLEAPLPLVDYVALMREQARACQERTTSLTRRRRAA